MGIVIGAVAVVFVLALIIFPGVRGTISLPATMITVSTTNSSSPYLIWAGT